MASQTSSMQPAESPAVGGILGCQSLPQKNMSTPAQCSSDPCEIDLCEDHPEELPARDGLSKALTLPHKLDDNAMPYSQQAIDPVGVEGPSTAAPSFSNPTRAVHEGSQSEAMDIDDSPDADPKASHAGGDLKDHKDPGHSAQHLADMRARGILGYVTSCAPEGVASHSAMALCRLEGLFAAWHGQADAAHKLHPSRHTRLCLWAANVRGGGDHQMQRFHHCQVAGLRIGYGDERQWNQFLRAAPEFLPLGLFALVGLLDITTSILLPVEKLHWTPRSYIGALLYRWQIHFSNFFMYP